MPPYFSFSNAYDKVFGNVKMVGNTLKGPSLAAKLINLNYLCFGKFGVTVPTSSCCSFRMNLKATYCSTRLNHIVHVVLMSAWLQMVRIAAQSIMAVMTNNNGWIRQKACRKQVGHSVCAHVVLNTVEADAKFAVTTFASAKCPGPARSIRLVNVGPKPLCNRFNVSNLADTINHLYLHKLSITGIVYP